MSWLFTPPTSCAFWPGRWVVLHVYMPQPLVTVTDCRHPPHHVQIDECRLMLLASIVRNIGWPSPSCHAARRHSYSESHTTLDLCCKIPSLEGDYPHADFIPSQESALRKQKRQQYTSTHFMTASIRLPPAASAAFWKGDVWYMSACRVQPRDQTSPRPSSVVWEGVSNSSGGLYGAEQCVCKGNRTQNWRFLMLVCTCFSHDRLWGQKTRGGRKQVKQREKT